MPEHMKRREAVYYFRRVLPKDLQAALGRRETCVSLKTKDYAEAKRRLHIEVVRFDQWVRDERAKLSDMRQMVPANENARPSTIADAMEEYARESDAHFAQLYAIDDEEDGLPYDQWVVQQERRDREANAEFFAEEQQKRTVPLGELFDSYAKAANLPAETRKQWRAVIRRLVAHLGHDNALKIKAKHLRQWRDHLREAGNGGRPLSPKTINDSYLTAVRAAFAWAVEEEVLDDNPAKDVRSVRAENRCVPAGLSRHGNS